MLCLYRQMLPKPSTATPSFAVWVGWVRWVGVLCGHVREGGFPRKPNGGVAKWWAYWPNDDALTGGQVTLLPKCDTSGGKWPMRQARESLPPDYDGWLQYTELNVTDVDLTGGFDQFSSVMSVPDEPKKAAQDRAHGLELTLPHGLELALLP